MLFSGKCTVCGITRIWHIKTRARTVIKKMCQIYISCYLIIWLYIQVFFPLTQTCQTSIHVLLPHGDLSVRLLTQLLQRGSRMLGRICQAREADSPKPWFQALHHLISSSQAFCLERPDLICSLAVNAIRKAVEMFVKGCQVYWTPAVALIQQSSWAAAWLSECMKSVPCKFVMICFSA